MTSITNRKKKYILQKVFKEMNEFDPELKFTLEEANPTLTFLDTEIYVSESGILEHKFFRKEMASSVLTNFEHGVIPRKYLISTLSGEIYRHSYCNSTESDLKESLNSLRTQFSENGYPSALIEEKIWEISSRKFAPKPRNVENIDYNSQYTIVLPFTSSRCENISLSIVRAIKN